MRGSRDAIDGSAVRNLDQIQEHDPSTQPSRAGALVLSSLGGACIVFAAVLLLRSPAKAKVSNTDPLGDLVALARPGPAQPATDGVGQDVTFPALLSDAKQPTTALEATRDPKGDARLPAPIDPRSPAPVDARAPIDARPPGDPRPPGAALPFELPPGAPTAPPPAADRLPVVPLPAQNVLQGPPADAPASDTLAAMAKHASRETGEEMAPAGSPGGFQLQVSSFKTQAEADAFAAALRRRSHKAYVEPAQVKGRGTWYRVRVGPFKYRHAAVIYRQEFEAKERMVTFIIDTAKDGIKMRPAAADDE
jgi:DedD protein